MRRLKGIVPVLVTPFNKDQTLDLDSLKKVILYLVDKSPGGFWVLGTGGEDMNLTFSERVPWLQPI